MDEGLNDDQRVLLDASTRFIEKTCPLARLREGVFDDPEFVTVYRRQAAALGWYSLVVPEERGGGNVSGNGVADAALVAYRRGRQLQPDPYVATNVVCYALASAGNDEQRAGLLPALVAGDASATWAIASPHRSASLDGVVRATAKNGTYRLAGRATFVEDAGPGAWLLVAATTEDGPAQFLVPPDAHGRRIERLESLDVTRRFVAVDFDDAELPASAMVGDIARGSELLARELAVACVLTVAESVGAFDALFDMTVEYAKDRIAFGRPIGSFQAIKHALADTSLNLEMSKGLALAAAQHVGEGDYGLESASMAKAFVGDVGIDAAQTCFQVFGGIGFTWEHDQHLYLRRLTSNATLYGDAAWHRERVCQLAGVTGGAIDD